MKFSRNIWTSKKYKIDWNLSEQVLLNLDFLYTNVLGIYLPTYTEKQFLWIKIEIVAYAYVKTSLNISEEEWTEIGNDRGFQWKMSLKDIKIC